jgi:hypothetical protein
MAHAQLVWPGMASRDDKFHARRSTAVPKRFVNQPDGKLAVFSTVIDDFTHYDLDEAEALEYGIEEWGRETAEAKIKSGRADGLERGPGPGDGLGRWREALTDIATQHGMAGLKETLSDIGFPDAEIPQSVHDILAQIAEDEATEEAEA